MCIIPSCGLAPSFSHAMSRAKWNMILVMHFSSKLHLEINSSAKFFKQCAITIKSQKLLPQPWMTKDHTQRRVCAFHTNSVESNATSDNSTQRLHDMMTWLLCQFSQQIWKQFLPCLQQKTAEFLSHLEKIQPILFSLQTLCQSYGWIGSLFSPLSALGGLTKLLFGCLCAMVAVSTCLSTVSTEKLLCQLQQQKINKHPFASRSELLLLE